MNQDGRRAWRKALADLHKQQRRDRYKRRPASPGPGMLRRPPPPEAPARPDEAGEPDA